MGCTVGRPGLTPTGFGTEEAGGLLANEDVLLGVDGFELFVRPGLSGVGWWTLVVDDPAERLELTVSGLFGIEEVGLLGSEDMRMGGAGFVNFSGLRLEAALCKAEALSFCALELWALESKGLCWLAVGLLFRTG